MKKRIFKILLTLILLFSIGVSNVYAESLLPQFVRKPIYISDIMGEHIVYDWHAGSAQFNYQLCAGSDHNYCKHMNNYWNLYSVEKTKFGLAKKTYILYCLNPSKAITGLDQDQSMVEFDSLDSARFSNPNLPSAEKEKRIKLLKQLLLNGYVADLSNQTSLDTLVTENPKNSLKLIAMQVLVWEVMEGGRTNFDSVVPDYHAADSFYAQVVYPNGGAAGSGKTGATIYYYYYNYIQAAKLGETKNPAPAFDKESYNMTWDKANSRYQVQVQGLGDYTSCSSDNSNITLNVTSNKSIFIYSSKPVNDATITCKYYRGNGYAGETNSESFKYFEFVEDRDTTQDMVSGNGWRVFSNSFKVKTENTDFSIVKVDANGKQISDVKFNLTHTTNTSYSVTLKSNVDTKYSLNYSGEYRVREINTPTGYTGIKDFNLTIDGDRHIVTKCDGEQKLFGRVSACLDGQVGISYSGNKIIMKVINIPQSFKILKYDQNNNPVKGASFEIRDLKDNPKMFTTGGSEAFAPGTIFKYTTDSSGSKVIHNYNNHSYQISLLPAGEYKIVEMSVPSPYRLPQDEEARTTYIKIDSKGNLAVWDKSNKKYISANTASVVIRNYSTSVVVNKVGSGEQLAGVQFELYNADRTQKIKCVATNEPGIYRYSDNQDLADVSVFVTNANGEIRIEYIPEGTYYFKEIYTPSPYVLPKGDAVFKKFTITIDEQGMALDGNHNTNVINISNTPNSFNFYKRDTEGNPLTTGKYKLQKYDKETKKYVDLKLVKVDGPIKNTDYYKVDEKNGKIQFTLSKGVATFIDMESNSTYRIIETVAPEGYTRADTKDAATAHIDEYGNASGLLVLVDQKIVKEDDSAFAELIINIQTGKQRIMYAAVIFVVLAIVAALIIFNKKK